MSDKRRVLVAIFRNWSMPCELRIFTDFQLSINTVTEYFRVPFDLLEEVHARGNKVGKIAINFLFALMEVKGITTTLAISPYQLTVYHTPAMKPEEVLGDVLKLIREFYSVQSIRRPGKFDVAKIELEIVKTIKYEEKAPPNYLRDIKDDELTPGVVATEIPSEVPLTEA